MSILYSRILKSNSPIIMGILNVTPDSFSDGGKYLNSELAFNHLEKMIEEGAEIIDIGGESTRPGAGFVTEEEELLRVIPVIKEIKKKYNKIFISVDTTKSKVAEEAIKFGADLINDISGGVFDNKIIEIAAESKTPIVVMHIKGNPKTMQDNPLYNDVTSEVIAYLKERLKVIKKCGVTEIIIDPGIGFGKTVENNFSLLKNLDKFKNLEKPILIGVSKKSFLGKTLNLEIDQRANSTIITETIAALKGAKIIRTHNVKNAVELKTIYQHLNKPIISEHV
ncbi:MAG: dihydropteroate synthase [Ignavibacteriales bacterium]|nr:dihydropteroate synthase [Ignavibacteriales bacterium]